MYRVDPNVAGSALRIRFAPLAYGDLPRLRVLHTYPQLAVARRLPQVVNVRQRCSRQTAELLVAEHLQFPSQQVAHCRSRQILVGGIDFGQQLDIYCV
jgi:hypothetical protein